MKQDKLKIAIVVHGRFHAFDLARALIRQGHKVILFTNYPKWAMGRFGVSPEHVRSFWLHGILSRLTKLLCEKIKLPYPEAWLHRMFGRWVAKKIREETWDVIHCWSGISEEILKTSNSTKTLNILMRGSSHIRTQACILEEEEERTGMPIDRPSSWMIARERREYALADYIMVLGKFAYTSFIKQKVDSRKLLLISLGVQIGHFRPSLKIIEDRCRRVINGEPLRVLYTGAFSFRKGMWDMMKIINKLETGRFQFRFVGSVSKEGKRFLARFHNLAEFISKQPQAELPKWYAWGDIFIFPTIEDGYAQVLAQAQASGLPILGTTNCAAPDIVIEGKTGWVLPIRSPESFIDKLLWCDGHRDELAEMAKSIYENFKPRDWQDVAEDFVGICSKALKER